MINVERHQKRIKDLRLQISQLENGRLKTGGKSLNSNGSISSSDTTSESVVRAKKEISDRERIIAGVIQG